MKEFNTAFKEPECLSPTEIYPLMLVSAPQSMATDSLTRSEISLPKEALCLGGSWHYESCDCDVSINTAF